MVDVWILPPDSVAGTRWSALAADHETDGFHTADPDLLKIQYFRSPAPVLRVVHVHPVHFRGKQGGFISACAGADFHDDVLLIIGILGKKEDPDLIFKFHDPLFGICQLFFGQLPHLFVALFLQDHEGVVRRFLAFAVLAVRFHKRHQVALLFHELTEPVLVGGNIGACQLPLNIFIAQHYAVEFVKHKIPISIYMHACALLRLAVRAAVREHHCRMLLIPHTMRSFPP